MQSTGRSIPTAVAATGASDVSTALFLRLVTNSAGGRVGWLLVGVGLPVCGSPVELGMAWMLPPLALQSGDACATPRQATLAVAGMGWPGLLTEIPRVGDCAPLARLAPAR